MQAGTHGACGVGWWTGPGGRETRMLAALLLLSAAASAASKVEPSPDSSVQSLLNEEAADVFLAKATLQHNLAPWANRDSELKTFQFAGSRQVAPGVVLIQVGEDTYRSEEQGMSVDDPAVYLLIKSRGGFLVADKKGGLSLAEVTDQSVRIGYPGYVDQQIQAQARRESALFDGRHR